MAMMSPSFYKLLLGQTVSWFGTLIGRLALPFVVIYILKASALDIAWVRLAEMVPGALVGLFVGVWVDRLARRLILVVSDVARACLAFTVPLAIAFDHLTLILVVVVAGLVSLFTVSFDVAYEAYLPELVPGRDLVTANRYLSAGGSVAEVMGFAVAGLLFESIGGAWTLSVDAMTYVLSAWSLLTIRATASTAPKTTQPHRARIPGTRAVLWYNHAGDSENLPGGRNIETDIVERQRTAFVRPEGVSHLSARDRPRHGLPAGNQAASRADRVDNAPAV